MAVKPTKCPELNKSNMHSFAHAVPVEVLVRYQAFGPGQEKVTGIICPEYIPERKICRINNCPCYIAEGFRDIRG